MKKATFYDLDGSRQFSVVMMAFLGILAFLVLFVWGGLQASGVVNDTESQTVWQEQHDEWTSKTYDGYIEDTEQHTRRTGVVMMGLGVFLGLLLIGMANSLNADTVVCPKGHVNYKGHSYCHGCGVKIFSSDEISPAEWKKRYEEAK